MKNVLFVLLCSSLFCQINAQSLEELLDMKAEKAGLIDDLQAQIDAAKGEVNALQKEIDVLSGWRKGVSGILGFDFNRSNTWIANPNPDTRSSKLGIDLTGYVLNDNEKTFWHNKAHVLLGWNDVDFSQEDFDLPNDGLFNNGTIDLLNISSLAGYKFRENLAASAQLELNTSIGNFLEPGTLDIGIGITWLPFKNLTVTVHPFNYNIAFPANGTPLSTTGTLGAKVRADYFLDFVVLGKDVNWTTSFAAFFPYSSLDPIDLGGGEFFEANVNYYTWLNNLTFEVYKGIGVGFGFGVREADFEADDLQSYFNVGVSYTVK